MLRSTYNLRHLPAFFGRKFSSQRTQEIFEIGPDPERPFVPGQADTVQVCRFFAWLGGLKLQTESLGAVILRCALIMIH